MHTYFAFKIIKMPKFYFFRNLRKILSQIRVLNVKIGWVFTALVCFKKGEKIAKNAPNGCFLPFNTVLSETFLNSLSITFQATVLVRLLGKALCAFCDEMFLKLSQRYKLAQRRLFGRGLPGAH